MDFLVPSWEDIYQMCIKLADRILISSFKPDIIVAVARGGWIPGRLMSDLLGNSNVANIRVEFYKDIAKTSRKPVISQGVSAPIKGRKVLVVDDVSDTGESLKIVREYLEKLNPAEIRIATLHYKPESIIKPEYFIERTNAWIIYPHERHEFVKTMVAKFRKNGISLEEAKRKIKKIGIDERIAEKFVNETWTTS